MSKSTLTTEIHKELAKLNDRIDRKIIKGQLYQKEARRHKELLATLQRVADDSRQSASYVKRHVRRVKSPARRRLAGSVFGRLLGMV